MQLPQVGLEVILVSVDAMSPGATCVRVYRRAYRRVYSRRKVWMDGRMDGRNKVEGLNG